jgi:hypothetical protein
MPAIWEMHASSGSADNPAVPHQQFGGLCFIAVVKPNMCVANC